MHKPSPRQAFRARPWRGDPSLVLLRALAVLLPLAFLVSFDVVRHQFGSTFWHSQAGFLLTYSVIAGGVVWFAATVFGTIERYEAEQRVRLTRTVALRQLASATSEHLDLDRIVETGLDHVLEATGADAGLVCRVFAGADMHSALCARGFSGDVEARIQRAKLSDDPVAARVVRTGQPVLFRDVFDDPRVVEGARAEGIESGVSVPLVSGGGVNGIIALAYRRPHEIVPAERDFLRDVGQLLGMAIRNATLYEDSVRRNSELEALVAVADAVGSSMELDQIVERSLAVITSVTSTETAELWLPDGDGVAKHHHDGPGRSAFDERTRFEPGRGFPGRAFAGGQSLITHALESDPRVLRRAIAREGFQTLGAFPIRHRDATLGVLTLASMSGDALRDPVEIRLVEAIVDQMAPAIENARLRREMRNAAILEERERISREMHDGLGQVLGYVNTQVLAVRKLMSDGRLDRAAAELERLESAARTVYEEVREGILALRTTPVEQGAVFALREYARQYRDVFDVDVELLVDPQVERLPLSAAAEIQLIRIVQEAISNARRHADASHVQARFACVDHTLRVEVVDDGRGFDPDDLPVVGRPRFGLQTMRERAQAVGGSFEIRSTIGSGTTVAVQLPVDD